MSEIANPIVWQLWAMLAVVFVVIVVVNLTSTNKNSPFSNFVALSAEDMRKPVLWLYYDTDDINSRRWSDFGARSERALNAPFLNLCHESIISQNKNIYRIEVIGGLTGVADLLGGWDTMPSGFQMHGALVPVRERELNWIRTAILAKHGGLWVCPHSIAIRPFGELSKELPVFFGTDMGETYAGKEGGTVVPGFNSIWSPRPGLPFFTEWEQICRYRLDNKTGGQEIRRDENWDWVALSSKYPSLVNSRGECSRKEDGKRIEIEDLLATGCKGLMPFSIASDAVYVPLFWRELKMRTSYEWFLRLDEFQIMESDLVVRYIFDTTKTKEQISLD